MSVLALDPLLGLGANRLLPVTLWSLLPIEFAPGPGLHLPPPCLCHKGLFLWGEGWLLLTFWALSIS